MAAICSKMPKSSPPITALQRLPQPGTGGYRRHLMSSAVNSITDSSQRLIRKIVSSKESVLRLGDVTRGSILDGSFYQPTRWTVVTGGLIYQYIQVDTPTCDVTKEQEKAKFDPTKTNTFPSFWEKAKSKIKT